MHRHEARERLRAILTQVTGETVPCMQSVQRTRLRTGPGNALVCKGTGGGKKAYS